MKKIKIYLNKIIAFSLALTIPILVSVSDYASVKSYCDFALDNEIGAICSDLVTSFIYSVGIGGFLPDGVSSISDYVRSELQSKGLSDGLIDFFMPQSYQQKLDNQMKIACEEVFQQYVDGTISLDMLQSFADKDFLKEKGLDTHEVLTPSNSSLFSQIYNNVLSSFGCFSSPWGLPEIEKYYDFGRAIDGSIRINFRGNAIAKQGLDQVWKYQLYGTRSLADGTISDNALSTSCFYYINANPCKDTSHDAYCTTHYYLNYIRFSDLKIGNSVQTYNGSANFASNVTEYYVNGSLVRQPGPTSLRNYGYTSFNISGVPFFNGNNVAFDWFMYQLYGDTYTRIYDGVPFTDGNITQKDIINADILSQIFNGVQGLTSDVLQQIYDNMVASEKQYASIEALIAEALEYIKQGGGVQIIVPDPVIPDYPEFDDSNILASLSTIQSILNAIKSFCNGISDTVGNIASWNVPSFISSVEASFSDLIDSVGVISSIDFSQYFQKVSVALDGLPTTLTNISTNISSLLQGVQEIASSDHPWAVDGVNDWYKDWLNELEYNHSISGTWTDILEGILEGVDCIPGSLEGILEGVDCLLPSLEGILEGVDCIPDIIADILDGVLAIPDVIVDGLTGVLEIPDVVVPDIVIPDIVIPDIAIPDIVVDLGDIWDFWRLDINAITEGIDWEFALPDGFNDFKGAFVSPFVSRYSFVTYPVFKIDTPQILIPYYNQNEIILYDTQNHSDLFYKVRQIISFCLYFGLCMYIIKALRGQFIGGNE